MLRLLTNTIKDRNTLCLVIYSRFYIRGSIIGKYGRLNEHVSLVRTVHNAIKTRTYEIDFYRIKISFYSSTMENKTCTVVNASVMNWSVMNILCYERGLLWTGQGSVMNVVCYERGMLWMWSDMNMVWYEHGLLWTRSVMNVVCLWAWSVMNVVCCKRGLLRMWSCYERVCYELVFFEVFCYECVLIWIGLLRTWSVNVVGYERGLLWMWFVMNVVCYEQGLL